MKRSFKLFILTLIIGVVAIFVSDVHAATYEHLYYSVENNEVTITGYDGTEINNLQIPSEIDGMQVTKIGNKAFDKHSEITGILNIPDTVKSIGAYAFRGCTGFTGDLIIPDSVTDMQLYAFYDCTGFNGNLIVSKNLSEIPSCAFWNCSGLVGEVVISENIKSIKSNAFALCKSLSSMKILGNAPELQYSSSIARNIIIKYKYGLVGFNEGKWASLKKEVYDLPIDVINIEDIIDYSYCGTEIEPNIVATYENILLEENKDYKIEYSNNVNVGQAKITIEGIGNLYGTREIKFNILKTDISKIEFCEIDDYMYSGIEVNPNVYIKNNKMKLIENKDYIVEYLDNINIGQANVKITGVDNCTGTKEIKFNIIKKDLGNVEIVSIQNPTYTTNEVFPELVIKNIGENLEKGKDYRIYSYSNNIRVGQASFIIYGIGNYVGTREIKFDILPRDISDVDVVMISENEYTTGQVKPNMSITYLGKRLIEGIDFEYENISNINAGSATIDIIGKGNYTGTKEVTFTIMARDIADAIANVEDQIYNMDIKTPEVEVIFEGNRLVKDIDYTVLYNTAEKAGEASLIIIGKGNYRGGKVVYYNILPMDIAKLDVYEVQPREYTGDKIEPYIIFVFNNVNISLSHDTTIEYFNNIDVGTATVMIVGKNNFVGTKTITFEIIPKDINEIVINDLNSCIYNTNEIKPAINVQYGKNILVEGTDFTVEYKNNKNAGEASVIITGLGNYTSETEVKFKILPEDISKVDIEEIARQIYTSKEITPKIKASYNGKELIEGTDYILTYENNIKSGVATIVVKGIGNYSGERKIQFVITADVNDLKISTISNQAYTGKAIEPKIVLSRDGVVLERDKDYTVEYKNNVKLGTATVIITGIGDYSGTKSVTFKIVKNITSVKVSGIVDKTYTGSKQTQKLTVKYGKTILTKDKDYTLTYSNNVNKGIATITINGKGNYAGTKKVTFKIGAKSITKFTFSKVKDYTYTGKVIKPNVSVKNGKTTLTKDKDYTVSYKSNTNKGTATITITGKGNYTGTKKLTFKIKARSINSVKIEGLKSKTYTGKSQKQSLKLTYNNMTLVKDKDYILSYKNNINKGTATVTITGKGNYTGTKKLTFNIKARSVNELSYTKVKNYTYIGKSITPSVTVKYGSKTLKKNTNYTISYKNNKNVGTATITITGKGNFTGTKKITFKINQRDISSATASGIKTKTYTGSAIKQSISLKYGGKTLKNKTDYTISYKNNVNKGTATITITGKGNFKGTKKVTFKIKAKDIANLSFSKILNRPYTGSAIKPGVTIKNGKITLKNGTDYTIKYSNNVKIGTATITITGKGNYTGSKKIKFKIEKQSYYIKVNYKANVVTIYQKGESGKYDKPIKAMICSTGTATPKSGKYGTKLKWSWLKMYGNVYGHYVTQITGDILFHSVPYLEKSIDTLEYWEYDKLGTSASMGCVRLTAKDAKWIYDKIPKGTTVEFYSSSNPGPLGKPEAMKISSYKEYRNWDPTDPSSKNPWKEIL